MSAKINANTTNTTLDSNFLYLQTNGTWDKRKNISDTINNTIKLSSWELGSHTNITEYNGEQYIWYKKHKTDTDSKSEKCSHFTSLFNSNYSNFFDEDFDDKLIDFSINNTNIEDKENVINSGIYHSSNIYELQNSEDLICQKTLTNLEPGHYRFSCIRVSGVGGNETSKYVGYTHYHGEKIITQWFDTISINISNQFARLKVSKNDIVKLSDENYVTHNIGENISSLFPLSNNDRWNYTFIPEDRLDTTKDDVDKIGVGNKSYCINVYDAESLHQWTSKYKNNFLIYCDFDIASKTDVVKLSFVNIHEAYGTGVLVALKDMKLEYI